MASKTAPGDGQTNPFGNGKGSGGPKAPPFDQAAQKNPQKPYNPGDVAQAQTPEGGTLLLADPPKAASSDDVGTRAESAGNRPPFRLKG
jgi:hypothetical protein